jgi:hypothetical protein
MLKPRAGFAADFFPYQSQLELMTSSPATTNIYELFTSFGSTDFLLKQSILPVVAWVEGEPAIRCIGTAFVISCTGYIITACHVLLDPQDRSAKPLAVARPGGRAQLGHSHRGGFYMEDRHHRNREMFLRLKAFAASHTDIPATTVWPQLLTDLNSVIADLDGHVSSEEVGKGSKLAGTTTRGAAREALREDVEAIVRTARIIGETKLGFDDKFRMPRGDNDQAIYRFRGASFGSFKLFLQRFADSCKRFRLGAVEKAAGVDDDEIGAGEGLAGPVALGAELGEDEFGVGQRLGAAERDEADRGCGPLSALGDCGHLAIVEHAGRRPRTPVKPLQPQTE